MSASADGLYIDTAHGRIYCVRYRGGERAVLCVSPFAEEMNRSRRMWTLLAQALGARGVTVLIPDLFGTGESDGDFADARWELWLEDLRAVWRSALADGAAQLSLVGVRLGALLALDFARRLRADKAEAQLQRIILWQPVLHGEQFATQFLRLKLAAGMRRTDRPPETTASLRERLASGEGLEVAGYELSGELVASLDELRLTTLLDGMSCPIDWFELSTSEPPQLTAASRRELAALAGDGRAIEARVLRGEPFWSLQEITVVPELADATARVIAGAA
jgi:exosortase A-associated hydrolase 2